MRDLSDTEVARLQALLDELAVAAPARSPLDVSALDGFLCAVVLQPQPLPKARWWPSKRLMPGSGSRTPRW